MPIYEYECANHGKFDENRPIKLRAFAECPICGTIWPKNLTVPHVVYKGSGFTSQDAKLSKPENPLDTMD